MNGIYKHVVLDDMNIADEFLGYPTYGDKIFKEKNYPQRVLSDVMCSAMIESVGHDSVGTKPAVKNGSGGRLQRSLITKDTMPINANLCKAWIQGVRTLSPSDLSEHWLMRFQGIDLATTEIEVTGAAALHGIELSHDFFEKLSQRYLSLALVNEDDTGIILNNDLLRTVKPSGGIIFSPSPVYDAEHPEHGKYNFRPFKIPKKNLQYMEAHQSSVLKNFCTGLKNLENNFDAIFGTQAKVDIAEFMQAIGSKESFSLDYIRHDVESQIQVFRDQLGIS
ncbi:MAG: hypothetical protein FWE31_05850 [Firmicutes bacterium]|nr:hypothetical protein [Bacillota bacterium]